MPQHTKPGLIETAGGALRCPLCRSDRVQLRGVMGAFPGYSFMASILTVEVTPAHGGTLTVEAVASLHLSCVQGHLFRVEVVQQEGIVAVSTEWDDDPEPEPIEDEDA
jgi:hypothetical protein